MNEMIKNASKWRENNLRFSIATVINTWGSAPRKIGSMMFINEHGDFFGSVSGGCVETAVIQESLEVLKTGIPKILSYGVPDVTAWGLGLACGGNIEILCQVFNENYVELFDNLEKNKNISYSIQLTDNNLNFGNIVLDKIPNYIIGKITHSKNLSVFHNFISQPIQLIIIGAVQISQILADLGQVIGYSVTIIDPRKAFATTKRFPNTTLVNDWPDRAFENIEILSNTAIVVLSHNPEIDDPALLEALQSKCFYIGALGSIRTQSARRTRLKTKIDSPIDLARIKGPAGLDIKADSPEEIAVSILAEIIKEGHH